MSIIWLFLGIVMVSIGIASAFILEFMSIHFVTGFFIGYFITTGIIGFIQFGKAITKYNKE